MAKKSKSHKSQLPTLHKTVPHVLSYAVLILLFLLVVKYVKQMVGVGY